MKAVALTRKAVADIVETLKHQYDYTRVDEHIKGFFDGKYKYGGSMKKATELQNTKYWLEHERYRSGETTSYYRHAMSMDKNKTKNAYWSNDKELFARAFESYVYDTLDGSSPYLVNGFVADGATKPPAYRGIPYPEGEERTRFREMFDGFVKNLEWSSEGVRLKEGAKIGNDAVAWRAYLDKKLEDVDKTYSAYQSAMKAEEMALLGIKKPAIPEPKVNLEDQPSVADSVNTFKNMDDSSIEAMINEVIAEEFPETINKEPEPEGTKNEYYPFSLLNYEMMEAQKADDWKTFWEEYAKLPIEEQQNLYAYSQEHPEVMTPNKSQMTEAYVDRQLEADTAKMEAETADRIKQNVLNKAEKELRDGKITQEQYDGIAAKYARPEIELAKIDNALNAAKDVIKEALPAKREELLRGLSKDLDIPVDEIKKRYEELKAVIESEKTTGITRVIADEPTLKAIAKDFLNSGIQIGKETLDGLHKLFGGGNIKSFPAGLDRAAYEEAKPHFIAAYKATVQAGHSAKEFIRLLVKGFGEKIKPYLFHFIKETRDGIIGRASG